MTLKKMRPAVLVCTVLVSTLTTATIFAGPVQDGMSDEKFAGLAVLKKADPTYGKVTDKSAVTNASGIDSLIGNDAKPLKLKKSGFVRMMEVKYTNGSNQSTVAQLIQFANNNKAESYFVGSISAGSKVRKNGLNFRNGNLFVSRVGGVVLRINGANVQASKNLTARYRSKIIKQFSKIKTLPYKIRPASKSVKLAAAAGKLTGMDVAGLDQRLVEPVSAITNPSDYVSFMANNKKRVRVFIADFETWKKSLGNKKLSKEQSEVAAFVKNYVNRFRYFKTPKAGGYAIVGRYKGFVIGIHRVKNGKSTATPKVLKTILERNRIKLFFGAKSAQKADSKPGAKNGDDADDSDDSEDSGSDDAEDSGADEESEEGGSDSESDSEDTE